MYARHSNSSGKNVPYQPLRRIVLATTVSSLSTSSTSLADITNATVTFTTTGGRLFAGLIADLAGGGAVSHITISASATHPAVGYIEATFGATLSNWAMFIPFDATNAAASWGVLSPFMFTSVQPAGSITVKLRWKVLSGDSTMSMNARFIVIEMGDE